MNDDMRKLIDEVERLDREATPGPWHRRDAETENGYVTSAVSLDTADEDGLTPCDLPIVGRTITAGIAGNDAALIAHYRTAAPLLAAEVERLDARLAEVERERDVALADVARLTPPKLAYALSVAAPTRPPSNTCNKHDDCEAADREAETAGKWRAAHCYDETCEDCFGS